MAQMTPRMHTRVSLGRTLSVGVVVGALMIIGVSAFAHEVLPQVYLDFVRANPNATQVEVDAFLDAHPELASDPDFVAHMDVVTKEPVSWMHNVRDFVRLGIIHILEGADHVLFVLSLVLIYTTFRREILLLSVFTVAHSISLILAGTGVLTLSSRIVEPVVALSITYMAITSVFLKHIPFFAGHANKVSTVFLFGLFHGLGFAGLLKDIRVPDERFVSSLLSFNIGIELGQLAILAAVLPFVYIWKDKLWYPSVVRMIAVVIASVGLLWGFQRIFL
jgi:hydrogenase/urease accessory protein HupE